MIGTTPEFTYKLPFETNFIKSAEITFAQGGNIVVRKTTEDCKFETDTISISLTQEESFLFKCHEFCEIQLRVLTQSGDVLKTLPESIIVTECYSKEILK